MTLQAFVDMYLDYRNNFLTVEAFADYYRISVDKANQIIKLGREVSDIEM